MFSTQAAGQRPSAGGDVGHLGDGLHLLRTAYTHLQETGECVTLILSSFVSLYLYLLTSDCCGKSSAGSRVLLGRIKHDRPGCDSPSLRAASPSEPPTQPKSR